MMRSRQTGKYRNIGLLVLRIGLGLAFVWHGIPKLLGGPEAWTQYGAAMQYLGIDFAPMFFGFLASIIEVFGGILLMVGVLYRTVLIFLILTMIVALVSKIGQGAAYPEFSHPLKMIIVFVSMMLIGPGKHSMNIGSKRRRRLFD